MSRKTRRHADIEPNLTSLIDVTFLLIVFFVLVSHINEVESVDLDLPRPTDPATVQPEAEHQLAISVIPSRDGLSAGYRIGERTFSPDRPGLDSLTAHLLSLYVQNPQINFNIRADRATQFQFIEPLMQSVSKAAHRAQAQVASTVNPRVNLMVVNE